MLIKLWHKTVDLIYPPFCSYCLMYLNRQQPLCATCTALIKPIVSIAFPLGRRYIMMVHAAGAYEDPLRPLIKAKFYRQHVAARQLAHILWEQVLSKQVAPADSSGWRAQVLVPVPLHWTRKAWRGYNQAEVIARELSRLSGIPVINALRRVHATKYQSGLSANERPRNMRDAFVLAECTGINADTQVLLIDDLVTTGSTLIEAGRTMAKLRPASINALVACRAV